MIVGVEKVLQPVIHDIAELPHGLYGKITGIDIPVVFHDEVSPASLGEGALEASEPGEKPEHGIKEPDGRCGPIPREVSEPAVEKPTQEVAVSLLDSRRVFRVRRASGLRVEAGYELHVREAHFLVESIDLFRKPYGVVIHDHQGVDSDFAVLHTPGGVHHLAPGSSIISESPVSVVNVFGTVQGKADKETISPKKIHPLLVNEETVGLQPVANGLSSPVPLLQSDCCFKECEAHECRFAPLP
jgi:hypothetical protein